MDRGDVEIATCEAILTEVVYVLSSRASYGLSHEEMRARLAPQIRRRGLRLPGKHLYLRALNLLSAHPALDFEDSLCVVQIEQFVINAILSYDTDFARIPAVQRVEP